MVKNVYIHIPFCKSKCKYCSFISFDKLNLKKKYLIALEKQIKEQYKDEKLHTLYIGGGTPSILSAEELKKIISLFNFDGTEITVEVNPEGVTKNYLKEIKSLGVNRLSIGSQTFDDKILKQIGRIHDSKKIDEAVKIAREVGFKNINIDLIYGLPTQNLKGFKSDLEHAINLGIEHISLYGLKIETGCYFDKNMPQHLPNIDEQADMYLLAAELIINAGFQHYEISNFAKPSFESRHNLNYWNNNSYYGFGLSASGYIDKKRYTNEINIEKYIKNPHGVISEELLSNQEILEEEIFLGFRKMTGINIYEINEKFQIDFDRKYAKLLKKYIDTGHIKKTKQGYALTIEGVLISNDILSEFID